LRYSDYKEYWPALLLMLVFFLCARLLLRESGALLELRDTIKTDEILQTSPELLEHSISQTRVINKAMRIRVDSLRKDLTAFTNQGEIVNALTKEINCYGVQLVTLKPAKLKTLEDFNMLPLEVHASGSSEQVYKLIYSLESKGNNYKIRRFFQQISLKKPVITEIELELDVILYRKEGDESSG